MALHPTSFEQRAHLYRDLIKVLLIAGAAIGVVIVMTVIFGLDGSGPSLEILPNPAGFAL